MNPPDMNRKKLSELYRALANLETIERNLEEWQGVLDDPNTRYGFHDSRDLDHNSRRISVVIRENLPDSGPNRHNQSLEAEFWTEESIRQAIALFMQGLQGQAQYYRDFLIENGVDPATPSVRESISKRDSINTLAASELNGVRSHSVLAVTADEVWGTASGHDEPPDYGSTFKSGRGAIAATPRQGRPGRAIKARAEHFGKRLTADERALSLYGRIRR